MSTAIFGDIKRMLKVEVVTQLPTIGKSNRLYFVLNGDTAEENRYDEYIWVKDEAHPNGYFELVGYKYVDLSPYYTKTEVDNLLSKKVDLTEYNLFKNSTNQSITNLETKLDEHIEDFNNQVNTINSLLDTKLNITDAENTYVVKEEGKGLSDNNFNNTYKSSLDWIEEFNTVSTLINIPCTRRLVIANIAVSETMSISADIPQSREMHIIIKNTSDTDITITLPTDSRYINLGGNSFIITPHSYAEVNIISNGTTFYVRFKEYPQEIIMTIGSNPEVMAIMYQKGLCANADYMTKDEAEAVVKSDFLNGKDEDSETISPSDSIFYNTNIVNFDELKYFTGIKELPTCTFHTCKYLTSVTLQDGLTKIGDSCFANCSKLEAINLPEKITYVASNLCKNCTSLKSIAIPNGVTIFYDSAFDGCSALESITIPDGVTSIGSRCFTSCRSIKSVTIPKSVDSIGERCFYGCSGIKDLTIEESDKTVTIGRDSFDEVYMKVTNLTVLCNEVIGDGRFYATHITANVTNFNGCFTTEKTAELHLGPRVSSVAAQPMYSKVGMNISVDENNVTYSSVDGVLFNKDKTKLIRFSKDALQPNYEIPSSVTSIGDYAFHECRKLTNINIPSGVTAIGSYALSRCTSLTQISLPSILKEIGTYAFFDCTALESINIPSSVTSIVNGVFAGCSSLASEIEIPSEVTYIGRSIFEGCSSLPSIKILGTNVSMIDSDCFSGCVSLKSIYCNTPTAPSVSRSTFGFNESTYTGRNTYNTSENILYVPANSTGYDSSYWLDTLCNPNKCGFTLHYDTPKYIESSKAVAGDYCLYDKQADKLVIVQNDKLNADDFPLTDYTPVGVVAIPGSHDVYGDGSCGVMSLVEMSYSTPDTGSINHEKFYSGNYGYINVLTNFRDSPYIGIDHNVGDSNCTVIGKEFYTYIPSDYFHGTQCPHDKNSYYTEDVGQMIDMGMRMCAAPSPYLTDNSRNSSYYQTSSPSSELNCLSDFGGNANTTALLNLATGQSDWKTSSTITNSNDRGYSPAACCCWRFHTDGTKQGDWYLPAMGELGYIISRLKAINTAILNISTVYNNSYALTIDPEIYDLLSSTVHSRYSSGTLGGIFLKRGKVDDDDKQYFYVRAFLRV